MEAHLLRRNVRLLADACDADADAHAFREGRRGLQRVVQGGKCPSLQVRTDMGPPVVGGHILLQPHQVLEREAGLQ